MFGVDGQCFGSRDNLWSGRLQRLGHWVLLGLLLSRGLGLYWVWECLQHSTYWVLGSLILEWRTSPTLSALVIGKWWGTGFEIHLDWRGMYVTGGGVQTDWPTRQSEYGRVFGLAFSRCGRDCSDVENVLLLPCSLFLHKVEMGLQLGVE